MPKISKFNDFYLYSRYPDFFNGRRNFIRKATALVFGIFTVGTALIAGASEYTNHEKGLKAYRKKDYESALGHFENAMKTNNDAGSYAMYSNCLYKLNRHDENLDFLEDAVKKFPQNDILISYLAREHYNHGNKEKAIKYIEIAKPLNTARRGSLSKGFQKLYDKIYSMK
jgi:tetratricopeptide (TPR) repeat protein